MFIYCGGGGGGWGGEGGKEETSLYCFRENSHEHLVVSY